LILTDNPAHIGLPVLRLLADGRRHSGEELAGALGLSRAAVWKQVQRLESLGLEIDVRRGVGYRVDPPLDVLDASAVRAGLGAAARERLQELEILSEVESTNTRLLDREQPATGRLKACIAEYQSGGRGRRGRSWVAPPGRGLCLSVAWAFPVQPEGIEALGLAIGAIARRVLIQQAGLAVRLKWPNDLVIDDRKLGGILVELVAEGHGACYVVIGIGINVSGVPRLASGSDAALLAPIDLATALNGRIPSRNALAGALIDALGELCARYASTGFGEYYEEIVAADYLRGRVVEVDAPTGRLVGEAVGISAAGRLIIARGGEPCEVVAGEVSVRPRG